MSESFEETEENEVFRKFVDFYTPSEEDRQRQFTTDQLEELCRRLPCRVEMSRWNLVRDYERRFLSENRLQHKTPHQVDRLLEKAVNRHKADDYTNEEKLLAYEEDWLQRKRDNYLRLRLWEHNRKTTISEDVAGDVLRIDTSSSPTVVQADVALGTSEGAQVFEYYMNVNSESITIGTESLAFNTESQSVLPSEELQSQPSELSQSVLPSLELQSQPSELSQPVPFEEFSKTMPLASTPNFDEVV